MIWWCRGCGMEDTRVHSACSTCGSALQPADIEWLNPGDEGEETVFELELTPVERAAVVETLISHNVRHRWDETNELVVSDFRADEVDELLDEIIGDSEDDDSFDDDDDDEELDGEGSDEGYEVTSQLFVATGKALKNRSDDRVAAFTEAAQRVLQTAAPFGVDDETWADLQSTARNISSALAEDKDAQVDADLKGLQNQLQLLV
jgi:hypothetical protein